jgi:hypothetical protein
VGDLGRRALLADLGAEVDAQLPGRPASLGEAGDLQNAADPQVELREVVEGGYRPFGRSRPGPDPSGAW